MFRKANRRLPCPSGSPCVAGVRTGPEYWSKRLSGCLGFHSKQVPLLQNLQGKMKAAVSGIVVKARDHGNRKPSERPPWKGVWLHDLPREMDGGVPSIVFCEREESQGQRPTWGTPIK